MLNKKVLDAIGEATHLAPDSSDKDTIFSLLAHIQEVEDETRLRYRVAHEIYTMNGSNWSRRHVVACFWTNKEAKHAVDTDPNMFRCKIGLIHVIKINHLWHRINVTPYQYITGDPEVAVISRLDYKDYHGPT